MTIKMRIHPRLSVEPGAYSGATADILYVDGLAYKVFRVYGVAQPVERVQARFESETAAYMRAACDSWLRQHTATYYGPSAIDEIPSRCIREANLSSRIHHPVPAGDVASRLLNWLELPAPRLFPFPASARNSQRTNTAPTRNEFPPKATNWWWVCYAVRE